MSPFKKNSTVFFVLTLTAVFILATSTLKAQDKVVHPTIVRTGVFLGETPPLRDLPPLTQSEMDKLGKNKEEDNELNEQLAHRSYPFAGTALPKGPDAAWQKSMGKQLQLGKAPIINFAGQTSSSYPPDCNGAVGPNHFMQTVNVTYSIYNKSGSLLAGPTALNTLFSGQTGASCNDGDPIVLYDEQASRWLVVEFSLCGANDYMLIAVSTTNDPTGTWYKYSFDVADVPDYEKFGIWQDGYYMGVNNSTGNDIYVFERSKMLLGQSAQMIGFDNPYRPTSIDGFMCLPPVDNDGTFAPTGAPGTFIAFNDDAIGGGADQLWIYELSANWTTPASSTFTRTQQLAVTPFDSNFGSDWYNISQPGTTMQLDAIPQVIMNVPQYRNFGTYQTLVCCHTVDVDNTDHAGVRWYELRRGTQASGNWSIRQQGTYAPDANSRWMGSIMLNGSGKIGLGYSISSSAINPGIRYTGQSSTAYNSATGTMDIPEQTIQDGSFSQTSYERWGDYSLLSVDPTDDQTFWYTTEYMASTSNHATRIASFKFGNPPVVTTTAATSVAATTATLNGSVNPNGLATTYYFQYGLTSGYGSATTTASAGSGSAAVAVSANITGLAAATTYHFNLVGVNSDGTTNGSDLALTTTGAATVTTTAATAIAGTTATSGGTVTSDGGSAVTARGVCWATTANPVATGNHTTDGSGTGTYTSSITGLTAATLYHYRAYATNVYGTFYGSDLSFTTSGAATVTTTTATAIDLTTATAGGNVTADGGSTVTARGVCWATTASPVATGSHTTDGSGTGTFTSSITGLSSNILYHYRAYATNANGTYYGSDLTFTTLCGVYTLPFTESFSNTTIPNCWTQVDNQGNSEIWLFGTITGQSPNPALTGNYAYLNSDAYGNGNSQNADLVTPTLNLTGYSTVTLAFNHYFQSYSGSSGTLSYSINNGTSWTALTSFTTTSATNPVAFSQAVAAVAGQAQVKFKWNYTGTYGYYWGIDDISITGTATGPAVVTTTAASSIAVTTATSGGNVTSIGSSAVTARGVCWSTAASPTITGNHTTDGSGIGTFTSSITGLTANTTYHIRAYATNTSGTSYGNDLTFLTPGAATVTTTAATTITMSTALSGGTVTSDGGVAVTARGVCWATTLNPVATGNHTTDGSGTGTFTSSISGLSPITLYHYRAYATNAAGTFYGSDLTFTTACGSINTFPWNEGFENAGSIPSCWTQEQVSSSGILYTFITGSGNSHPTAAHLGTYNACLKDVTAADNKTKLISPSINLSGVNNPTLTFWHTQAVWGSDQDQLIVYYRTSAAGAWVAFIPSYTTSVTTWTQRTITLPNGSGDYYIAFEGNAKWGYGVCIDDVQITCTALPVSVAIVPSANPVCSGTSVTYTATPANGGTSPAYQWKVNGTNVTGATSSTYAFIPATGNTVACVLTSSAACITGNPATSNTITMTVNPSLPVGVSIAPSANPVLTGSSVLFTATPVNGGATPGYQWKVNAATVTGATNSTYTYIPSNNDAITCILMSNATCATGNPATSAAVTMTVNPLQLSVTPANQDVTDAAGVAAFAVTSNTSWLAGSNQAWCTVNPSGTGNGTISATYSQNLSNTPRVASITVTVSGLTPVTVTLTQLGVPVKHLNLTVFLEGLFNGSTMNKARNATGDQFAGTIADQITLELHYPASPYALAGGPYTVNVNTDGTASVTIPSSLGSSYYLVVKHRNSIETWNGNPLSFSGAIMSYNFSTSAGQAYGNNLKLMSGKYVVFSGDVNQDGIVDAGDLVAVDNDAANFINGYLANDVNGDGVINLADINLAGANASVFVAKIVP